MGSRAAGQHGRSRRALSAHRECGCVVPLALPGPDDSKNMDDEGNNLKIEPATDDAP